MLRLRVLIVVVAFAGCSQPRPAPSPTEPKPVPLAPSGPAEPAAEPMAQAQVAPPPQQPSAQRDLAFVPADSELVGGIDVKSLRTTALWNNYSAVLLRPAATQLAAFKLACGFDPVDVITSVTFGLKPTDSEGVFVLHGLDKTKVMRCVEKAGSVSSDGIGTLKSGGETMVMTFTDDDTLLVLLGRSASPSRLGRIKSGGESVTTSPTFMELFSRVDATATLWMLINGNAPFMQKVGATGLKSKAIFGSVNVTDRLASDLRVRMSTPDEALQLATMGKGQSASPQVMQLFDKLEFSSDGVDTRIVLEMTQDQIETVRRMIDASNSSSTPPPKKDSPKKPKKQR